MLFNMKAADSSEFVGLALPALSGHMFRPYALHMDKSLH